MRWLMIYYVVGLIVELAAAAWRWDRKKKGLDRLFQDHDADTMTDASYTALVFLMIPVAAFVWPAGVAMKLFPRLVPGKISKYLGE
jgi:hypothetical protein